MRQATELVSVTLVEAGSFENRRDQNLLRCVDLFRDTLKQDKGSDFQSSERS